jgi:hypothetical protein
VKFGVLVAVFGCIALMVVVGMSQLGCTWCSVDEEKLTVNLGSPEVVPYESEGAAYWDTTIQINKVTPKDRRPNWRGFKVLMRSAEGNDLNVPVHLVAADPGEPIVGTRDGHVCVWYTDDDGNSIMDAGEDIIITGLNRDHEGATLALLWEGERAGSVHLPSVFS